MNQTQENSRQFLQQAIDARIKSLEESFVESVRVLKLERNALAPVSSLPPEILAVIFSFLCLSGKLSLGGGPVAQIHLLSHVCHQWREIALNQSLLWSHVDFTTFTFPGAAEILARAKSAPLYLEARISGRHRWNDFRFATFREELQARIPHICHLGIRAKPAHIRSTLSALVSPAPTLEYLSLFSTEEPYSRANVFIPDTLFDGSAPRLSCLKLRDCIISWKQPLWPLLKGLKYLEILLPLADENSRPKLADWLGTLAEMPELKTLSLQRASPEAPPVPFDVERTVTLPTLTEFGFEAPLKDCVLALAHLDLPALTWLSLEVICISFPKSGDVQELHPYIARFANGTQHTQPLQSMLIHNDRKYVEMLAWPVPDIDVKLNNLPNFLDVTLSPRLWLSFRCDNPVEAYTSASGYYSHLELLDWLMTGLPLDDIVTLAAQDLCTRTNPERILPSKQFWLHISPKFPQLRRVILSPPSLGGFAEMLLEDNEERERPLLPSLTELTVVDASDYDLSFVPLYDALKKRVEQGVPLAVLDLRMHRLRGFVPDCRAEAQRLSEIVVDVLPPEPSQHVGSHWKPVPPGVFLDDDAREDSDTEEEYGEYTEESF